MREIKFRAWSKELGMSENVALKELISSNTDFDEFEVYMQYTGLEDKNDREIYEGDILYGRWTEAMDEYRNQECCEIVKVYFDEDNGKWVAEEFKTTGEVLDLYDCYEEIEVMGNIYENADLLKG